MKISGAVTSSFSGRTHVAAAAVLLFALNLALHYPGEMNQDSTGQYLQVLAGRYNDWHPPIMAALWSKLRLIAEGPVTLLVFHLAMHWLAFGLLADALAASGRITAARLMLLAGAFPLFLIFNGGIYKDVGMASALILAAAIAYWGRSRASRLPPALLLLAGAALAYGTLVRTNPGFAYGSLLVFIIWPRTWRLGFGKLLLASILLAGIALPVCGYINRHVFDAADSGSTRSLQIFDLSGIAVRTQDRSAVDHLTRSASWQERCYTPYWWDPFSPWGPCGAVWNDVAETEKAMPGETSRTWISQIRQHTPAYLAHRAAHFNSMLYFLVPADHFRFTPEIAGTAQATRDYSVAVIVKDFVRRSPVLWPVVWLIVAIWALAAMRNAPDDVDRRCAQALILSGLLYTAAFALIGVATAMRYHYWMIMSVISATIIAWPTIRTSWRIVAAPVVIAVLLGSATRILQIRWFF